MGHRTRAVGVFVVLTLWAIAQNTVSVPASATSEPAGSAACPADEPTGEVAIGVSTEVRGFDTTVGGSVGANGGHERTAVFDVLMQYDSETGEFVPRMAESLEPNDDSSEWTLTMRDGITFANGNPVDTAAVQFSIDRHGAEDTASQYKSQVDVIESIEIVNDRTMVFHLSDPWGDFPSLLAAAVGMIVDPATFEELGAEAFGLDPHGGNAGPYVVQRFAPGEELILEARDNYWDGPVCTQTLRFVHIPDARARVDAFLNGELDVVYLHQPDLLAELVDGGFDYHTAMNRGGDAVLINHGTAGVDRPGSDVRVRQAIAYALDVELIDQRQFGGSGYPNNALVGEDSLLYTPAIEGLPYDPERARQLLAEAMADGYDGQLTLSCHNVPDRVEWAIAIEGLLESVGFDVDLDNSQSLNDFVANTFYTGDYDLACLNVGMDDDSPWATLLPRIGQDTVTLSRIGYQSERMAAAMDALRAAGTLEARQQALAEVQQIWNEEVPLVPTNDHPRTVVWHDNVEGIDFTSTATALFDKAYIVE